MPPSLLGVQAASITAPNAVYSSFVRKGKNLLGFLSISKTRYECRSFVNGKWHNTNF